MAFFEVTMKGYDASTDATDHLVKWVKAHAKNGPRAIRAYLGDQVATVERLNLEPGAGELDHDLMTVQ